MTKTIVANIPAKKVTKNGKTWTYEARTETFTCDADGRWSGAGIGAMLEAEVIDVCRKATNWSAIKAAHFAMDGFHGDEPMDRAPSHKSDL
jgi:hypothetical protein